MAEGGRHPYRPDMPHDCDMLLMPAPVRGAIWQCRACGTVWRSWAAGLGGVRDVNGVWRRVGRLGRWRLRRQGILSA